MIALALALLPLAPSLPEAPPEAIAPAPRSLYSVSLPADAAVIGAGALAALIPYAFASHFITPRCPCDPAEVNALDRHAIGEHSRTADVLSDVSAVAAVLAAPVLDVLDLGFSKPLLEDAIVYAEVIAVNSGLVAVVKMAAHRPLPRTYAGDPALIDQAGGYRSFYSGHTSATVSALTAASVTYARRHGGSPWPWVITALGGGSVGLERVLAGRHFPSDVAVGALAGALVGTLVPLFHARGAPTLVPRAGGAELSYALRF